MLNHAIIAAVATLIGLSTARAASPAEASAPVEDANVILIVVDALRADHLGCYGYKYPTSPRIDSWPSTAVLLEDASTQGTWTLPALSLIMSSLSGEA